VNLAPKLDVSSSWVIGYMLVNVGRASVSYANSEVDFDVSKALSSRRTSPHPLISYGWRFVLLDECREYLQYLADFNVLFLLFNLPYDLEPETAATTPSATLSAVLKAPTRAPSPITKLDLSPASTTPAQPQHNFSSISYPQFKQR
jgi:hypothetical protein